MKEKIGGRRIISFTTNDRAAAGTDGSIEYIPWSAICGDYQISANGICRNRKFGKEGCE